MRALPLFIVHYKLFITNESAGIFIYLHVHTQNLNMQYDPIKRSLGVVFNATPSLRKLFYKLLDLLLLRSWYIRRELKQWAKGKTEENTILDAGSGFGQYDYFMSGLGKNFKVQAVDVKQEQIDDCNQFFGKINRAEQVNFKHADLTQFIEEARYDFVLSVDVMEHIEEDVLVFKNFHKSMKSGATLLISTPSDQGGSDVHHDHEESFIDEHVRDGYNINEIREKLETAGFRNIEARYAYGKPGSVAWKLSMKYPIVMLNASKLFFVLLPFYYLLTYPAAFVLNYTDVNGTHKTGTGLIVTAQK